MSYNPQNSNGQKTGANSSPVVIASDQSAVQVSLTPSTLIGSSSTTGWANSLLQSPAQAIKATAGTIQGWYIYNPNSTTAYINFYSGGTFQFCLGIPPLGGANASFPQGIYIGGAITASASTSANGATSISVTAVIFYS